MVLQYVITNRSQNDCDILLYKDGKLQNSDIVSVFNMGEYLDKLREDGYTQTIDLSKLEMDLKLAKSQYEDLLEVYKMFKNKGIYSK